MCVGGRLHLLVEEATSLVILSRAYQKSHLSLAKFDGHHVVFGADFVLAFAGHNVFVQALSPLLFIS